MKLNLPHRLRQSLLFVAMALQLLLVVLTVFFVKNFKIIENNRGGQQQAQLNALGEFEIFMKDWCRVRQAKTDLDRLVYFFVF